MRFCGIGHLFKSHLPHYIEKHKKESLKILPAGIKKTDEAGEIQALINKYGYHSLNFKFMGDTNILYKRFTEREMNDERGEVNKVDNLSYEQFNNSCHKMDAFDIGGESIYVDTTDFEKVDFEKYIKTASEFLK